MKLTRTLLTGTAIATLAFSALAVETAYAAGSDDGMPPNVAAAQAASAAPTVVAERFEPQLLRDPNGQTRSNPAFKAQTVQRATAQEIRAQSVPSTRYVGA